MLSIVGLGPGAKPGRTLEAQAALEEAQVLCGYTLYLEPLRPEFPDKRFVATGMRGEAERCREALRLSREGMRVALCCSGDAQVYGMASLVLELADESEDVRVIPGVTAALSAAALLGAPLSGDFAVISLSDLLTPWERIERRLRGAGEGDFPVALYNPASRTRKDQLARACDILLAFRGEKTPCGIARCIAREGQQTEILTLGELRDRQLDMLTTALIGSSETVIRGGRLLTPRGYRL
ncbi:MAG: precorrin-3B C(17)-methyltransferase [Clostridia bacterium]|nr:precorrin-3B C(17)-methyltransferase [Clostridia bacterium]